MSTHLPQYLPFHDLSSRNIILHFKISDKSNLPDLYMQQSCYLGSMELSAVPFQCGMQQLKQSPHQGADSLQMKAQWEVSAV